MTIRRRARITPTEYWPELQPLLLYPDQEDYEVIRPVVLFGFTPLERSRETGVSARSIYRKAQRFEQDGLPGLREAQERPDSKRLLPRVMRRAIVELKAERAAFSAHELARICYARFGRRPSSHTIKRILAEEPAAEHVRRRFPRYAEMADPVQRRLAIVRLHSEGWTNRSIADYLGTNRPRVYKTLQRWWSEGVQGLEDKPPIPHQPAKKVDLQAMNAIRKLQHNPELGEFRVRVALKQLGINLSARTCGRILALNRKLYGLRGPEAKRHEPKAMPFKASFRHQYWTVDIRYLDHQLDDGKVYAISVLENYSRAILASAVSRTQDLTAFLSVLFAAVSRYGAPGALVSDGGSVFRAKRAMAIYGALRIQKEQFQHRQSWQSYIETAFNVQRRMADWHFARAQTWQELGTVHERWMADYNYQEHWAHEQRKDARHSPADVLGWVTGKTFGENALHRIFFTTRHRRRLDQQGYVRFRNWRIYGEQGLGRRQAVIWLYEEHLTLQYAEEVLAQYEVKYQPDRRHFRAVVPTRLFETRYQSPQLPLLDLEPDDWRLVIPLPGRSRRRSRGGQVVQPRLFPLDEVATAR